MLSHRLTSNEYVACYGIQVTRSKHINFMLLKKLFVQLVLRIKKKMCVCFFIEMWKQYILRTFRTNSFTSEMTFEQNCLSSKVKTFEEKIHWFMLLDYSYAPLLQITY